MEKDKKIVVTKNGPYLVSGNLPLEKEIIIDDSDGNPDEWKEISEYPLKESYALCRCGKSKNKPYCSGEHVQANFDGAETADREKYSTQAERIDGPDLNLDDDISLCSSAGFCTKAGGVRQLTKNSNDPKSKEQAIKEACNCPSGRLVAVDKKTNQAIEPGFKPSVSITEHAAVKKISGPIWVKGNIVVESGDGFIYETRNRVTLCRCGKSKNKPFCDGTHMVISFNDEK